MKGYFIPFEEWPEETKKVFTYDPEGAEALLDEAGYPRGADGIRFKTIHNPWTAWDLGYQEIAVEYWDAIGVDVEIRTHDLTQLATIVRDVTYEGMASMDLGNDHNPNNQIERLTIGGSWNRTGHQDPVMDAKAKAALAASTLEEQQRLVAEQICTRSSSTGTYGVPKVPQFDAVQPWVKGFNGEIFFHPAPGWPFSRLWIDSALKSEMGF